MNPSPHHREGSPLGRDNRRERRHERVPRVPSPCAGAVALDGIWYKRGRHGLVFRWSEHLHEWIRADRAPGDLEI